MVEFLNTEKAYSSIVEIVMKASDKVVLISPYIKIPEQLFDRLKYIDGKGIKTLVVCREKDSGKDLGDKVRSELKQLKNLELRFDDDLHAKCFYNEESMVITSLNLYDYSQQHNREMGILLSSEKDTNVFNEAISEAEFIVSGARKDSVIGSIVRGVVKEAKAVVNSPAKDKSRRVRTTSGTKREGYCIRCRKSIPYNRERPYCLHCARLWNKSGSYVNDKEKYCHLCGKEITTTMESPLCGNCYWETRNIISRRVQ